MKAFRERYEEYEVNPSSNTTQEAYENMLKEVCRTDPVNKLRLSKEKKSIIEELKTLAFRMVRLLSLLKSLLIYLLLYFSCYIPSTFNFLSYILFSRS
eukprot:m.133043 g.133043  ORF g.133043 m.133043 type:complete len:98 (+) comp9490_c0_seq2:1400-1693(+)